MALQMKHTLVPAQADEPLPAPQIDSLPMEPYVAALISGDGEYGADGVAGARYAALRTDVYTHTSGWYVRENNWYQEVEGTTTITSFDGGDGGNGQAGGHGTAVLTTGNMQVAYGGNGGRGGKGGEGGSTEGGWSNTTYINYEWYASSDAINNPQDYPSELVTIYAIWDQHGAIGGNGGAGGTGGDGDFGAASISFGTYAENIRLTAAGGNGGNGGNGGIGGNGVVGGKGGDGGQGGRGGSGYIYVDRNKFYATSGQMLMELTASGGAGGAGGGGGWGGAGVYTYFPERPAGFGVNPRDVVEVRNDGADGRTGISGGAGFACIYIRDNVFYGSAGDDLFDFTLHVAGDSAKLVWMANNSFYGRGGHDTIRINILSHHAGGAVSAAGAAPVVTQVDLASGLLSVGGLVNQISGISDVTVSLTDSYQSDDGVAVVPGDAILNGNSSGNVMTGGAGNDSIDGRAGNDALSGGGGDDYLDGGTGADTLTGGDGNDAYVVNSTLDIVVENGPTGGFDLVNTYASHTLADDVEMLIMMGFSGLSATGNAGNNILLGNVGNNRLTGLDGDDQLDGGVGNDTLIGGLGNDTYYVDQTGDRITEVTGEGTDEVVASINFVLTGLSIERLTLTGAGAISGTGNSAGNVLTGNSAANQLDGGAGADRLDGGQGADTLIGGTGNDTFVVDSAGDVLTEAAGGGTDLVEAGFSCILGAEIENLTLTGTDHLDATGNGAANRLTGNGADNVLDGGAGNDILTGGLGNDTYYVDSTADKVVEMAGQGTDVVNASASFALTGSYVESLILTGAADLSATGNSGGNTLNGNMGNNVLDGAAGNDTLTGGLGDDSYYVQSSGDKVVENNGEGYDVIYASATYTLTGRYAEVLQLTGGANIDASGNGVGNLLIGNSGANLLNGLGGNDTLTGGAGADTFLFQAASRADRVTDFSASDGDVINVNAYTGGVANGGLVVQAGADVVINFGGGNVITVANASQVDVLSHMVW